MSVVLIPIIKDKKAKISSIDNYRPVAIASVVSKVLERILLDRLSEYLDTMAGSSKLFGTWAIMLSAIFNRAKSCKHGKHHIIYNVYIYI